MADYGGFFCQPVKQGVEPRIFNSGLPIERFGGVGCDLQRKGPDGRTAFRGIIER
jgi:hypothetical protein